MSLSDIEILTKTWIDHPHFDDFFDRIKALGFEIENQVIHNDSVYSALVEATWSYEALFTVEVDQDSCTVEEVEYHPRIELIAKKIGR